MTLLNDLHFAVRGIRRQPGFTALAALTLALGLGATVAVASLIQALLLRPLPFPEADRLVRIMAYKGAEPGHIAQREIEELQRESRAFESVAAYYLSQYNVTGEGAPEAAPCAINTHQLFSVLGARFALGATFSADEDFRRQYRVVLTHGFWQRRFGSDPDIVGRSIVLDGGSYVVDGVLEAGDAFPPGVELYRQVTEYHGLDGRRHSVLARLRPGASLAQAQQELAQFGSVWQERFPELNRGVHFEAVPLRDSWVGAARPYVWLLAGAVIFVLLIAIANTAHLLLARARERQQDMAVRLSLGAGRFDLVRQSLVDSLVLAVLGGGLGLVLAAAGIRWFDDLVHASLPAWMDFRLDLSVFAAAAALVLVTGVLAGAAPALRSSHAAPGHSLRRARGSAGASSTKLRGGLVTGEIALALMLVAGAGLMIRSAIALDRQDLGFDSEDLFTVRVDPPYWSYNTIEQLTPFYEQALENLRQIPGVLAVAANQNLPLAGLDGHTQRILTLQGQSAQEQEANPFVHLQSVGPGYFDAMGIPLRRGRAFTTGDRQETRPVVVLSQRLADRLWPRGAMGQRLKLGPPDSEAPWLTVVGIAGNVHSERRSGSPSLDLYVSHLQHFTGDTFFALRTSLEGAEMRRRVGAAIQAVDPDLPLFDVASMNERLTRVEWQRQTTSQLFSVFGALALALAACGIYSIMSYHVTLRRPELGIRQALGARPWDLLTVVFRQGVRFLVQGAVLGILGGLALGQLVESLLFGVEATDPANLAVACLVLAVAVFLASLLPALRAARLDPVTAIRGDGSSRRLTRGAER
ncbi:MAG: ADOP family duplicated permease [Acidobacteriota bacterium]